MFRFLFILALVFLMQGCAIQDVEMVRVNNVYPESVTGDAPRLRVNVRLNNPNKFNIKVKKAKVKLTINGNDGGEIGLGDAVVIEKLKEDDYEFILVGEREKILNAIGASGISAALTGKVQVNLKGWVKGKAFGLGKKIQIDEKKTISLKDLQLPQNME